MHLLTFKEWSVCGSGVLPGLEDDGRRGRGRAVWIIWQHRTTKIRGRSKPTAARSQPEQLTVITAGIFQLVRQLLLSSIHLHNTFLAGNNGLCGGGRGWRGRWILLPGEVNCGDLSGHGAHHGSCRTGGRIYRDSQTSRCQGPDLVLTKLLTNWSFAY